MTTQTIHTSYDLGYADGYAGRAVQYQDLDYLAGYADGSYEVRQKIRRLTSSL